MRGICSIVFTLGVTLHVVLVSGKALIQQNNQQTQQQQLEQKLQNVNDAQSQRRVGYDYPAPTDDLHNPFIDNHHDDHDLHEEHHEEHHDHHDPGYWKKKLIWKPGYKKIWKPATKQIWKPSFKKVYKPIWKVDKKQIWVDDKKLVWQQVWQPSKKLIWVPDKKLEWQEEWKKSYVKDFKQIWVPGVKKIWRPVFISEWFPLPDHHEHVHQSHGWDRSDNSAAGSQTVANQQRPPLQPAPQQPQQANWQSPNN